LSELSGLEPKGALHSRVKELGMSWKTTSTFHQQKKLAEGFKVKISLYFRLSLVPSLRRHCGGTRGRIATPSTDSGGECCPEVGKSGRLLLPIEKIRRGWSLPGNEPVRATFENSFYQSLQTFLGVTEGGRLVGIVAFDSGAYTLPRG